VGAVYTIPDIEHADGNVGPPLNRIGSRVYLTGLVRNSPANMADWIQQPERFLPGNAMPSMGIPAKDARDITGYLTRRGRGIGPRQSPPLLLSAASAPPVRSEALHDDLPCRRAI
jgi:hypothetical protein